MTAYGFGFALLLLPAGGVALFSLVVLAFEVASRVLTLLALGAAAAGAVCGAMALSAASEGRTDRARKLMRAGFLLTAVAVIGTLAIPKHGE
ncbi:hypothetical protein BJY16_008685 [Actinoplanes octamycinicus]|uniref:Uncharacterized protein n=1 Tax=Actinoplanes octamycinicus TaxID=135948 RepID=A0A7W7H754_9ACTN|nr:hypothetical protein [Actinoplanes octamycinicus]MBB4745226.1 hypothetical protein [Actinoplanes octamycinicus]GIE62647.1 hypothetical protein Aoc01nite_80490 [Actinoplanes octamycinicus]